MEQIVKKFQKMGTAQLISKVEKLTGDERTVVIDLLKARNQDVSKWTGDVAEKVVFESDEPLTKEEAKQLSNAEKMQKNLDKAEKALNPAKAEKAPKELKVKKEKVVKEKKVRAKKEKVAKVPKTAPTEGSISAKVLELLKAGELSKYKIAKECGTHYSVVVFVEKHYLKPESAPEATDQASPETPAES